MSSNSQTAPVTPADYHMSARAHAAQERPTAPAKAEAERHGDLHVRAEEELRKRYEKKYDKVSPQRL